MSISTHSNALRQNSLSSGQQHDIAAGLLEAAAQASAAQESSGESGDDAGEGSPDAAQKSEKRKKRSRACQACRNMKIRCNPVQGQEACLACSKVNRECVMPAPVRKRQKTVHKVAELEKKINALTQSLLTKTQSDPTPQQSPQVADPGSRSTKELYKDSPDERPSFSLFPKLEQPAAIARITAHDPNYEDVIDRGIVRLAAAEMMFDKYMTDMNPLCPIVAFPPGTTFDSVRRQRPMLLLAIFTAACASMAPEIQSDVCEELASQLASRIFYQFQRSLDLIQACLVNITWVGRHLNTKEVCFNQYIHIAIVMAHELGMGKRSKTPLTTNPTEEAELRRTWLACYWSGTCVSTTIRQPAMVRNSPYIQECLDFFAESPAAQPTDQSLCAIVKCGMIMEDVASCFHMDDPAYTIRIEDATIQYSLKVFERRLETWRKESLACIQPRGLLELTHATASLYIHEVALHNDHNVDDFKPPLDRPAAQDSEVVEDFITTSHLDALTRCVVAMKAVFDSFIAVFPSTTIRQLPCLCVVWTAYAAIAMIRLDGVLRASKSKYADLFLPDLKISHYLDQIIQRLSETIGPRGSQQPGPMPMFVQAFQKLKIWHQFRLAGIALPAEFADISDPKQGIASFGDKMDKFLETKSKADSESPVTNPSSHGSLNPHRTASSPFQIRKRPASQPPPLQQQQRVPAEVTSGWQNGQGFDTHGGSWLTNSNVPIDASMFENQDWNFTLEDWSNFEASMVQPAGGTWLGYLL